MAALCTASFTSTRMIIKPLSAPKMVVPYELMQGQSRLFHKLPSGLNMEVISQKSNVSKIPSEVKSVKTPPLVFIHGSYHAAWCWAEHWLPFFSQNGFDCYALSLLGQGESDSPSGKVAGSLETHAADVANFITKEIELPPVLIGHSFGGLIVQYYIATIRSEQQSGQIFSYNTLKRFQIPARVSFLF